MGYDSTKLVRQALRVPQLKPTEKLVLTYLAHICDAQNTCHPSVKDISRHTSLSTRSIQRMVSCLINRGLITRQPRFGEEDGSRESNLYELRMPTAYCLQAVPAR